LSNFNHQAEAMKLIFSIFLLSSFSSTIQAQLVRALPDSMPVAGKYHQQLYDRALVLGNNQLGTVYALPQDRMPALRPDTTVTSRMPVVGSKKYSMIMRLPSVPQQGFQDSMLYKPGGPIKRMFLPKQGN
jgi:hypothetical protein